jgi:hypothetical protein
MRHPFYTSAALMIPAGFLLADSGVFKPLIRAQLR